MSAWVVVPCLLTLRTEFNQVSPNRDKGADGTIGDSNHTSTSDHSADEDSTALDGKDADKVNEVHALDVDSTGPWPDGRRGDVAGSWFDTKVKQLIAEEKRRWLDPNDMCRLNYVIWRGHIYDKDDNDFAARVYTGADPHTNHAHFSARYETRAETDTRPWGIWEDNDMPSPEEYAAAVWAHPLKVVGPDGKPTGATKPAGDYQRFSTSMSPHLQTQAAVAALSAQLDALAASVAALPPGSVSEAELTAALTATIRAAFTA